MLLHFEQLVGGQLFVTEGFEQGCDLAAGAMGGGGTGHERDTRFSRYWARLVTGSCFSEVSPTSASGPTMPMARACSYSRPLSRRRPRCRRDITVPIGQFMMSAISL